MRPTGKLTMETGIRFGILGRGGPRQATLPFRERNPRLRPGVFRAFFSVLFPLIAFLCSGCATSHPAARPGAIDSKAAASLDAGGSRLAGSGEPAATGSTQVVVVIGEEGSSRAHLYALERAGESWHRQFGPLPAVIGRNGFAAPGGKLEGDGKSPSGMFALELVFGYAAEMATRMPYRQASGDDLWVDDVNSPQYNRWVTRGELAASSYEVMRLPDRRYRHGIVTGYNRNPIVKGKGSAIFVHVAAEDGRATAGCVALDEGALVALIGWLDPAQRPVIVMGNGGDVTAIMKDMGLSGGP
ncbi:MAG TPA: L,D-transpeptidase family protein [Geomonas sp.]|nr:L,D-transpeptidase family protein [Geomonas sp.]